MQVDKWIPPQKCYFPFLANVLKQTVFQGASNEKVESDQDRRLHPITNFQLP